MRVEKESGGKTKGRKNGERAKETERRGKEKVGGKQKD